MWQYGLNVDFLVRIDLAKTAAEVRGRANGMEMGCLDFPHSVRNGNLSNQSPVEILDHLNVNKRTIELVLDLLQTMVNQHFAFRKRFCHGKPELTALGFELEILKYSTNLSRIRSKRLIVGHLQ